MSALVRVHGVHKYFTRGSERIDVLKGVNIEIPQGDFVALMGPSGSGKTTLLNLLGGIDKPSDGEIAFDGKRMDNLGESKLAAFRAANVGFVFQFYNLMPMLTAAQNVELPLLLTKLGPKARRERVMTAMTIVNLADRAKHKPSELSGGQQQRVAIARAIVSDPTLLLCDEPTGDLDRKSAEDVLNLLEDLHTRFKKAIVMVTHDPHCAERADRLVHLEKGVIVADA